MNDAPRGIAEQNGVIITLMSRRQGISALHLSRSHIVHFRPSGMVSRHGERARRRAASDVANALACICGRKPALSTVTVDGGVMS